MVTPTIFIFAKSIIEGAMENVPICSFSRTDRKQDTPKLYQFDLNLRKKIACCFSTLESGLISDRRTNSAL